MAAEEREDQNRIPCIVEEGILACRRDMMRVLRDLGRVRYTDMVGGQPRATGEGLVAGVFAHASAATLVFNRRLYLNVNGFEFLRVGRQPPDGCLLELVCASRVLRLEPVEGAAAAKGADASLALAADALGGWLGSLLPGDEGGEEEGGPGLLV